MNGALLQRTSGKAWRTNVWRSGKANTTKSGAKRPPETQIRELMRTFWDCNLDEAEAIEAIEAPGEPEAFLKERYEWCVAAKDERKGMADEAMEEWKEQQ